MKPNTLVIFKGSEIMHKSTAINDGEKKYYCQWFL